MTTVLFAGGGTGGHLYPALALAEAMTAQASGIHAHFVGARRGVEARVLPQRGVSHTLLPIEPIYRARPWRNWRLLPSLTRSLAGIARVFREKQPALVVGTGGYASAPACLWAVARRVPVAVQEQNAFPGATTRLLARYARQVHLGFPEAAKQLRPGRNTRVLSLGNPIRPPDPALDRDECRALFGLSPDSVVLLVVGGSQGSRAINEALLSVLSSQPRPEGLEVFWATGPAHFETVRARVTSLGADAWVHTHGYLDDMPRALAVADIALSRAGAMMTAELLAWGIPSVLIPLPTAAADHQTQNARALEEAGVAVCLAESDVTPASLYSVLAQLAGDEQRRTEMRERALERARPNAANQIAHELLTLVGRP